MITAIKPDVMPTGKYNTTETAKALGIHRHTLANWILSGRIGFGLRSDGKTKFFTGLQILRCWNQEY